VQKMTKLTVEK